MSPDGLASRVEDAGLNASAPAEQRWPDGWLLRDAAAAGARHACLQVEADNHPARAAYAKLGFADAYRDHCREPPAAAS